MNSETSGKNLDTGLIEGQNPEREHLTLEQALHVNENIEKAQKAKAELRALLSGGGDLSKEQFDEIVGRYGEISAEGIYNLDVPPGERFNTLTWRSIVRNYKGNLSAVELGWITMEEHIQSIKELINKWLNVQDNGAPNLPVPEGVVFLNNFHFRLIPLFEYEGHQKKHGQVLADFHERYKDLVDFIRTKYYEQLKLDAPKLKIVYEQRYKLFSQSLPESIKSKIGAETRLWEKELDKIHNEYYKENPDSAFAQYNDALKRAFYILINEYGVPDSELWG